MTITDPMANMFTIIRNASSAGKEKADVRFSKLGEKILAILKKEKYIQNFKFIKDTGQGTLRIYLKFNRDKTPVIEDIKRISKPGLRVYVKQDKIPRVLRGRGIAILSTSSGILTDNEARQAKAGGEIICYVW